MERYGSDKPDLRINLEVQDMTALVAGSEFRALCGGQYGQGHRRAGLQLGAEGCR